MSEPITPKQSMTKGGSIPPNVTSTTESLEREKLELEIRQLKLALDGTGEQEPWEVGKLRNEARSEWYRPATYFGALTALAAIFALTGQWFWNTAKFDKAEAQAMRASTEYDKLAIELTNARVKVQQANEEKNRAETETLRIKKLGEEYRQQAVENVAKATTLSVRAVEIIDAMSSDHRDSPEVALVRDEVRKLTEVTLNITNDAYDDVLVVTPPLVGSPKADLNDEVVQARRTLTRHVKREGSIMIYVLRRDNSSQKWKETNGFNVADPDFPFGSANILIDPQEQVFLLNRAEPKINQTRDMPAPPIMSPSSQSP